MNDFVPTEEMIREAEAEAEWILLTNQTQTGETGHWLDWERNRRLKDALVTAAACEQHIEPEQARLRILLEKAKAKPDNDVEVRAREFQIEYVHRYLTRAADIAQTRLAHFRELITAEQIKEEVELCQVSKEHWFRYYAWGYDPRARTALSIVPFELYPRQEDLVRWLDEIVFDRKTSGLIEKARDEGATELIVRWGIHCWLWRPGFSMLLSSRTEDEVDTKKKQGTLFERARFQIRRLPHWMLADDFDVEKALLQDKLIANTNGNALVGQAPVENMGRGDRVTCAMFDEFAFWRFGGYPQYRSMSQTTDSILQPSSVAGKFNQYADNAFDGVTPKFEMDWRDNPFKDKRWYDALPFGFIGPKMSRTTIAQEVDRNYEAAQPGKVWNCPETHVFITISEFLRPFAAAGQEHHFRDGGRFVIPRDWGITRTNDFGKSEGHEWAHLVGAQPRATFVLNDTHFIFTARNLEPTGLSIAEAVEQWRGWEAGWGLRDRETYKWLPDQPPKNWNSHEQDELRKVLLETHGENWNAWDTDYETGITTIEDWWELVDKHLPNPFRPNLMGRARLVFVAPDDEYELAYNERLHEWFVTVSATEAGFYLARKQISAYHYPMSELGKPVKAMRPKKEFDDIIDTIRGYSVNWNREPVPMSVAEAREAKLPEHLRNIEQIIATQDPATAERAMVGRVMAFHEMDKADAARRAQVSKTRPQVPKMRRLR
jgi:hypothetical protein